MNIKFSKYNVGQSNSNNTTISGNSSSSSAGGSEFNKIEASGMNRILWGNDDTGDDLNESMWIDGNIHIGEWEIKYEEDEDGDIDDENPILPTDDGTTGNLYATGNIEGDSVYGKTVYLDYPERDNKKTDILTVLKDHDTQISTNTTDIANNKIDIANNKVEIANNKVEITNNKTEITNNKTEITNIKSNITSIESDVADIYTQISNVTSTVGSLLPIGSIIMYNGTATLPDGWHICDGTGGTPNLIDKFIRGGNTAGNTGGSDNVTLEISNLPTHTHSTNISDYDDVKDKLIPALDEFYQNTYDLGDGKDHYVIESGYNKKSDKGLVGIPVKDLVGNEVGEGKSFSNMPSYYTLVFIMKIA